MHHLDMISEEDFLELSYTPSEKHSHPDDLRTTIMLFSMLQTQDYCWILDVENVVVPIFS